MKFPHGILLVATLAMVVIFVACGGGSGGGTTPPPVISVTLGGAPSSLQVNGTTSLAATVANDSSNAGVSWSVTCGTSASSACGTFSNTAKTSATYNAPAAVPTRNSVTVTATSIADTTKSASATFQIVTIAVTIGPAPTVLQVSGGSGLTAFVANDPTNAGVTWAVTCGGAGACGTFSSNNVLSGVATDFSAPSAVPTGNAVTAMATSVTDPTKSASITIHITTANTTLADGTYVFSVAGEHTFPGAGPYFVAGAFVLSGGAITSGEEDFIDFGFVAPQVAITGGSLAPTADGSLRIALTTTDTRLGVNGVETFAAALISSRRARIVEFDGGATSSGRVDLQTSTAPPSGGYAFFLAGADGASMPVAQSIGGVINVDAAGTISGAGSVFDINDGGSVEQAQSFAPSTVSTPDALGRVVFSLSPSTASGVPAIRLVGYILDALHIRLVETTDALNSTMGGIALGQGTNTGTFGSIAGNSYVVGLMGFDTSQAGTLQVAGVVTANSDGSVGGAINYNDLAGTGPETPSPITGGTYTVNPAGTGRVTLSGVTDGIATFTLQLYLTGTGPEGEVTAVTMDTHDATSGLGFQQTGAGSFTASSFFGTYALYSTGFDSVGPAEFDAVGSIAADGVGTVNGTVDLNSLASGVHVALPVNGSFTANSNGAFTGTITGLDVTNSTRQDVFSYYVIDPTKVFAIETDPNQLTFDFLVLQQ